MLFEKSPAGFYRLHMPSFGKTTPLKKEHFEGFVKAYTAEDRHAVEDERWSVFTREQILADIWDVNEDYVNDNTLTVYIKRLREKIEENPTEPKIIETVRGIGYKIGSDL